MKEHPIESLMEIAMNNIQDMVDVNTIIGEPIYISENISIIPISKVSFGFVAGGSEFKGEAIEEYKESKERFDFLSEGGSGAGINITPVSFMVINNGNIKLMPVEYCSTLDKIVDYIPDVFNKVSDLINKKNDDSVIKGKTYSYSYNEENSQNAEN